MHTPRTYVHVCTHTRAHKHTHTPSVDNTQEDCLQGKGLPDAVIPCRTPHLTQKTPGQLTAGL